MLSLGGYVRGSETGGDCSGSSDSGNDSENASSGLAVSERHAWLDLRIPLAATPFSLSAPRSASCNSTQDVEGLYAELQSLHALPIGLFMRWVILMTICVLLGPLLFVSVTELDKIRRSSAKKADECASVVTRPVSNITDNATGHVSECPATCALPNCKEVAAGELCEGDGECGTNNDLNNCCSQVYNPEDVAKDVVKSKQKDADEPTDAPPVVPVVFVPGVIVGKAKLSEVGFDIYRKGNKEEPLIHDLFSPSPWISVLFFVLPALVVLVSMCSGGLFAPQENRHLGGKGGTVIWCPVVLAILFVLLPYFATTPFDFLRCFAVEFERCKGFCDQLASGNRLGIGDTRVNETMLQCKANGMFSFAMQVPDSDILRHGKMLNVRRCEHIFQTTVENVPVKGTPKSATMTSEDAFDNFGSKLKAQSGISDWEVYGCWVGIYEIALLGVGQLILLSLRNRQAEELREFIKTEFRPQDSLHGDEEQEPMAFRKRVRQMEQFMDDQNAFAQADLFAQNIEASSAADESVAGVRWRAKSMTAVWAGCGCATKWRDVGVHFAILAVVLVFSSVTAMMPAIRRWFVNSRHGPLLHGTVYYPLLLTTVGLDVARRTILLLWIITHFVKFGECKVQVIAFDMLWCFPGQDREVQKLMVGRTKRMPPSIRDFWSLFRTRWQEGSWSPPCMGGLLSGTNDKSSDGDLRMVDWSSRFEEGLFDNLWKLEKWFAMRRFIQLQQLPTRLKMEAVITVGLLTLLPKVGVACWQCFNLAAGSHHLSFVTSALLLWDLGGIMGLILFAVANSIRINRLFDDHLRRLGTLKRHVRMQKMRDTCRVQYSSSGIVQERSFVEGSDVLPEEMFVSSISQMVEEVDDPCLLFGTKVSNAMMAPLLAAGFWSIAPSMFFMARTVATATGADD